MTNPPVPDDQAPSINLPSAVEALLADMDLLKTRVTDLEARVI